MRNIKAIGYIMCSALCLALCGCSGTNKTSEPLDPYSSTQSSAQSYAASSSEQPTSSEASSAASSSAPQSSSDAPSEPISEPREFTGSIKSAVFSNKNVLPNSHRAEFAVDNENGRITLDVTYENYIDIKTLQNCFIDIEAADCEFRFSGTVNANGSVDLTKNASVLAVDQNGTAREYPIVLNRTVYDLPIVNIYLADGLSVDAIDRDVYSDMSIYIDCSGAEGFESADFMNGGIHGRGHSTWKWDKKPYRIKLDSKAELLGLPANKDWVLMANHADKSLMRNIVAYDMGRTLGTFVWTATQYPVDLFVNGEYRGVYALGEQREIAKSRIDLYESPDDPDRGYLIEVGGADGEGLVNGIDKFHVKSGCADNCTFVDPKPKDMTDEQRKYIIDYVNAADNAIVNGGDYEEYIDIDSFMDWIIMHELTCNLDSCFRRSCYFNKNRGGKLEMGPIWDFDLAFGNFSMDNSAYNTWFTKGSDEKDAYIETNWCSYLMADEKFRSRIKARWFEVRGSLLDAAEKSISRNSALIERSQAENFRVWQTLGIKSGFQSQATAGIDTYAGQVQYLRDFIKKRAEWIDENI